MKTVCRYAIALALLAGSALGFAESDADTEKCISTHRIDHTEIVDGETILFHMVGKKVYVNKLPRRCPGLSFHKAFSYKVSQNRLCNTDIIRVYQGDYFGAACGLGKFEPYDTNPEAVQKTSDS